MAYRKRKISPEVAKASKRRDSIRSIEQDFDLGNGLTEAAYTASIDNVITRTQTYNTQLSVLDGMLTDLEKAEKDLRALTVRMLTGVGSKHGYDSVEYEKAGGTRKSDRKRPTRNNGSNNTKK
jgi:hypothetical protein